MAQAHNEELFEDDTNVDLDELDAPESDLDDWGNEDLDDDLEGLSSDLDRWDVDDYDGGYGADRDYLRGLLR